MQQPPAAAAAYYLPTYLPTFFAWRCDISSSFGSTPDKKFDFFMMSDDAVDGRSADSDAAREPRVISRSEVPGRRSSSDAPRELEDEDEEERLSLGLCRRLRLELVEREALEDDEAAGGGTPPRRLWSGCRDGCCCCCCW